MGLTKHHENEERRAYCHELRTDDNDGRTVEGYAALTENVTSMGWYDESFARGAFDNANLSEVRALFNHDANHVLAKAASGTLKLDVDERGLKFRFSLPNTAMGNDLVELVKRGDVSQCSFAFTVEDQEWIEKEGRESRVISKVRDIYDVSLVTYPAYPDTSVALRSRPKPTKQEPKELKEQPLHSPAFRDDVDFFNQRLSVVNN